MKMHDEGPLMIRYYVEENAELRKKVLAMLLADKKAQLLMGDALKQDQFKFLFETVDIIYGSALQNRLINKDEKVMKEVIPKLVAFKALLHIRDIQLKKAQDALEAKEKLKRKGKVEVEEEKDELHMTPEELMMQKIKEQEEGKEEDEEELTEEMIAKRLEEKDRAIYGRTWIWDGYFNELRKDIWLETAEKLKHVNPHVLEDIEDKFLLEGFNTRAEKIRQEIEEDRKRRITEDMKLAGLDTEDAEAIDKMEAQKDKKRRFMNDLRPGKIWNFFEDCPQDEKVDHVMRYNAKPEACYVDGRINEILQNIESISANLSMHAEVVWDNLLKNSHVVFKSMYEKHQANLAEAV